MDQMMNFWFSGKAGKDMENVTKDINNMPKKIAGGANKMVNSVTAKKQKPLSELLHEFELPAGIFPREAKHYEFDNETKKLTVTLPTICEVSYRDSSVLRFSTSVTGHIEKGKISEIEGLKTRIVIWVKVTCIVCEEMNLHFTAGLGKTRSRKVYEMVRDGITVDKF
ncbi:uncharacterized protein At5g01610-like [Cynara cardunculus var. scolymus]|uniref:uncharacterized protein At5g01610-like n=1 Tax=Cynara cardunculus var. scolymus TaxID=59895 RepID=UPI000D62AA7C|nr:uncharacterized protein At5g01610-like [Cynara cardunculus var. scolymus]